MNIYRVTFKVPTDMLIVLAVRANTFRKALNKVKKVFNIDEVMGVGDNTYYTIDGKRIVLEHSEDVIDFERITNDTNGNPRYVCHYLSVNTNYSEALKLMKAIGGKKFNNKQYGGGIVFQSYNTANTKRAILRAAYLLIE